MNIQTLPYALPLVVSIGSSLLVVYYACRRHTTPGSMSLITMSCAMALWSFCTIVSMYQTDLAILITWANIQSISLAILPTGWLMFAVQYTGRERWLNPGVWRWLALEPMVFEVMIWTDRYHGLIRSANWLDTGGPFPMHLSTFAAGYWAHVGYSYILIAIGTILLIKELVRSYHLLYRGQAIALICAVAVPWVANVLQLANLSPIPNTAMTPLAFTITNIALAWGVLRYRLLDVVPIAREVVLDSMRDGVIVLDIRRHIADLNPAAQHMVGQDAAQLIGQDAVYALPGWKDILCTPMHEDLTVTREELSSDVEMRQYDIHLSPLYNRRQTLSGRIIVIQDTTERRRAEEERLKISKLESIGLLAGGIAHDFNNSLTAILGYITIARLDLQPDDPINERLELAEEATMHAKTLSHQLLTFAKGGTPIKELMSIPEILTDAVSFTLSGANVRCEWAIPENIWPAFIDPGQISQVIQNLVINADQAMPDGGVITIRCSNEIIDRDTVIQGITLQPGFYVKIGVRDQGEGIPSNRINRIFDPYFTTKETGSGLGLATSFSIVKRHDGVMDVSSVPGQGVTFDIYLPASSDVSSTRQTLSAHNGLPHQNGHRHGKILVMDDERFIREIISQGLERHGYTVLCASEGIEALKLYEQAFQTGEPFDVVVMDLTVPGGMGGKEMLGRLLNLDPHVKAIVSSGYSNDPVMADFEQYGFRARVAKPYRITDLTAVVKRVVEE